MSYSVGKGVKINQCYKFIKKDNKLSCVGLTLMWICVTFVVCQNSTVFSECQLESLHMKLRLSELLFQVIIIIIMHYADALFITGKQQDYHIPGGTTND